MSLLKCLPCNLNRFFRRPFTASTRIPSPTTTTSKYAKDQPAGFTNRIEKVAIVGAGGQVGSHLAQEILRNGKHVLTAIQRAESNSILPEGINVIRVDCSGDDDTSLVEALRGQQVLLIGM